MRSHGWAQSNMTCVPLRGNEDTDTEGRPREDGGAHRTRRRGARPPEAPGLDTWTSAVGPQGVREHILVTRGSLTEPQRRHVP